MYSALTSVSDVTEADVDRRRSRAGGIDVAEIAHSHASPRPATSNVRILRRRIQTVLTSQALCSPHCSVSVSQLTADTDQSQVSAISIVARPPFTLLLLSTPSLQSHHPLHPFPLYSNAPRTDALLALDCGATVVSCASAPLLSHLSLSLPLSVSRGAAIGGHLD